MFKGSSNNTVRRERNQVLNSRGNTGGIDPEVFAAPNEYADIRRELGAKKQDLEAKVSRLKANISIAQARRYSQGKESLILKWQKEKSVLVEKILDVEQELAGLKLVRVAMDDAQQEEFFCAFFRVCSENLAEPVFKRLVAAAQFRAGIEDLLKPHPTT